MRDRSSLEVYTVRKLKDSATYTKNRVFMARKEKKLERKKNMKIHVFSSDVNFFFATAWSG